MLCQVPCGQPFVNSRYAVAVQAFRTRSSHYQVYAYLPLTMNAKMSSAGLGSDKIATYTGPEKQSLRMGMSCRNCQSLAPGSGLSRFFVRDSQ